MSTRTFPSAMQTAVDVAAELITDGAADDYSAEDLAVARATLTKILPTEADIATLGRVCALGVEYIVNIDSDDEDEQWAVQQLGVPSGVAAEGVEGNVRWWFSLDISS